MALPSNIQCDFSGQALPFFSPYPTLSMVVLSIQRPISPVCSITLTPFPYPSPSQLPLFPHLIHFRQSLSLPCTLIIPDIYPGRFWWPTLRASAKRFCLLAQKGEPGILSIPLTKAFPHNHVYFEIHGLLEFSYSPAPFLL